MRTNHRFKNDEDYGRLLLECRDKGLSVESVHTLNERVVQADTEIPHDVVYATYSNIDRAAINAGIFANHVAHTHSKDQTIPCPNHTICVKASNVQWQQKKTPLGQEAKDILFGCCSDAHVRNDRKLIDPMLKLYRGCPLYINNNEDVENCVANGTM